MRMEKNPEGKWKREADCLSEEIAALRKEDKRIHAMLLCLKTIKMIINNINCKKKSLKICLVVGNWSYRGC